MDSRWLTWAKRLQAIGQNGLTFAKDPFDIERYQSIRDIALEILAEGSGIELKQLRESFSQEVGYTTPKVDLRGVVFQEEALLLVKERSDGRWTLPGGWADVCESASEGIVREIFEESGYQTRVVKLLAIYDRSKQGHLPVYPHHVYKLFFQCELLAGTPTPSIETEAVAFFREHEIPPLSLGRVTPAQITRVFEHQRHPEWPADYD